MYTIMDLHWIKRNSDGLLFTNRDAEYENFAAWCVTNQPAVADNTKIVLAQGEYKGQRCFFPQRTTADKAKRLLDLDSNIKRKRGLLIQALCAEVVNYITGRNDQNDVDPSAMLAAHGDVLQLLQQNRYSSAKAVIQGKAPDVHISAAEIDYILNTIYPPYEAKIAELV